MRHIWKYENKVLKHWQHISFVMHSRNLGCAHNDHVKSVFCTQSIVYNFEIKTNQLLNMYLILYTKVNQLWLRVFHE